MVQRRRRQRRNAGADADADADVSTLCHNAFLFAGRQRLDAASPEARCATVCAHYLQYLDSIPELAFDTPCAHNRPPTNFATRSKPPFPFVLDSVSMITREDSQIFNMGRGAYDTTGYRLPIHRTAPAQCSYLAAACMNRPGIRICAPLLRRANSTTTTYRTPHTAQHHFSIPSIIPY
ncbi:uncharacterized protein MYCFIDRAFT_87010 [Pseudocercospora fijiensis CIRAD86]|uniref:Uncharacterized protein n=1 Tax=Pseudocercospora fijiensis (strain CIRAD86) TaxID=383855 RepID=N1Q9S9_PSEFD|nr:uncharacterized protein MYCFIDRAFT_87010 [Pseudocercospora fijiensis CIRAD86]EME89655.1 hypothetical protein MYCFIDRAFT_87010 [Pseudocercospora fijiensis CIRAD86]